MIYELLIVFLIIGFSYIFKISNNLGLDNQLIFICLSFILIITYKMGTYHRMKGNLRKIINNEGFYDFSKEVNEFVSQGIPEGASTSNIQEYKEEINKLQEQVSVMNEYLNEISNLNKGGSENQINTPLDEINIQASQQIQDYRIKQLQREIEQTTDLIKKAKLRDDAKSFRKIPVYSSCVVSNADGSFSVDTPSSNGFTNKNTPSNTILNNDSSTNVITNNTNTNNSSTNTINTNTQDNGVQSLINSIQKNGININLDTTK